MKFSKVPKAKVEKDEADPHQSGGRVEYRAQDGQEAPVGPDAVVTRHRSTSDLFTQDIGSSGRTARNTGAQIAAPRQGRPKPEHP